MALYETVLIARQDLSTKQVEDLAKFLENTLSENGGKAVSTEHWGLRNLAYRIKKNRKGHYILMFIDAPSDAVKEMERLIRLNEDVLRYMTVKIDAIPENGSVMNKTADAA